MHKYPQHEQEGMVIDGILGGVPGAQIGEGSGKTAATIVGTMAGAMIGGAIGRSMDDTDRLKTARSLETVRTGVPSTWRNPDTGNEYTVVPTRTFDSNTGPCREYTVDARGGSGKRSTAPPAGSRMARTGLENKTRIGVVFFAY